MGVMKSSYQTFVVQKFLIKLSEIVTKGSSAKLGGKTGITLVSK